MRNSPIPSTVDSICQHTRRQHLSTPVDSIGEPKQHAPLSLSLSLCFLRMLARAHSVSLTPLHGSGKRKAFTPLFPPISLSLIPSFSRSRDIRTTDACRRQKQQSSSQACQVSQGAGPLRLARRQQQMRAHGMRCEKIGGDGTLREGPGARRCLRAALLLPRSWPSDARRRCAASKT